MIRIALALCVSISVKASVVRTGYNHAGLEEAIALYDKVIKSQEFEVLSRELDALETDNKVYERFYLGWEVGYGLPDGVHNFNLELSYPTDSLTIAYVYIGFPTIYFNPTHLKKSSIPQVVGTLCHEYAHLLGYRHTLELYEYRIQTVPYKIGSICETIARNYYSAELSE